jgi:pimeloyl-ACP methyl ester carboxylesterase
MAVGLAARPVLRRVLASGTVTGQVPRPWADAISARFDQGTQRAVLALLRAAPPDADRPPAPTLVLHGADDPWTPPDVGRALAAALPAATFEEVPGGGHWPWLEQPAVVDRAAAFLRL